MLSRLAGTSLAALMVTCSAAAIACDLPQNRPHQEFRTVDNFINTEAFVEHVRTTIGDDVMGYAVILRSPTGKTVAAINHGWAKSPCEEDGALAYNSNTVTPWASVTKMVTLAAVLNKIKRFSTRSIDERMIDHLPERWDVNNCDGSGSCWSDVEIRHLLPYQAGFGNSGGLGWPETLALPATPRPVGNRKYMNAHYSAWHYMGSFFAGGIMRQAEEDFDGADDEYEDYIFDAVREIWERYLKREVFDPVGIQGACRDVDFAGDNFALLYNYKTPASDGDPGKKTTSADGKNCTSGGIVMSVNDMSKFVHALANTDKIISKKQYENHLMITGSNVFGWNESDPVDDGRVWFKAGGAGSPGHVGAHIAAFSSGYTAVIAVNSFQRSDSDWSRIGVLKAAYEAGRDQSTGVLQTP